MADQPPANEPLSSADSLEMIDAVCNDFELKWKSRANPKIENFLQRIASAMREQLFAELLRCELELLSWDRQEQDKEEYLERFPQYDKVIDELFRCRRKVPIAESDEQSTIGFDASGSAKLTMPFRLGNYELLEELGGGGMGIVYKALQFQPERMVAIKLIRPDRISHRHPQQRQELLARFRNETAATAKLNHDHVVTVYDVGEIDGQPYYAMRYVEGKSLHQLLADGPLESKTAATYAEQVACAISEAHSIGVLHRDVKPHNVLIDQKTDRALLADFGLAKLVETEEQVTQTEAMLGSPPYMSPEQTRDAAKVTEATDIYGLGATLYTLLTGHPPFQAPTVLETVRLVREKEPVSPRELIPTLERDIETITLKCLEKEPRKRYASTTDLVTDLRCFLGGLPIRARPVSDWEKLLKWSRRQPVSALLVATGIPYVCVLWLLVAWWGGDVGALLILGAAYVWGRKYPASLLDAIVWSLMICILFFGIGVASGFGISVPDPSQILIQGHKDCTRAIVISVWIAAHFTVGFTLSRWGRSTMRERIFNIAAPAFAIFAVLFTAFTGYLPPIDDLALNSIGVGSVTVDGFDLIHDNPNSYDWLSDSMDRFRAVHGIIMPIASAVALFAWLVLILRQRRRLNFGSV